MKTVPSEVEGIRLLAPPSEAFEEALKPLLGNASRELIARAIPYSVIVSNDSPRAIALLGIRFDMTGPRAKPYSVIHYADTLRNPERADFRPNTRRFVCAEPSCTSLLLRGEDQLSTRARMNLDNLNRMLEVRASLDCVAFDDGFFAGPDTLGAFARLASERIAEAALVEQVLEAKETDLPGILRAAAEDTTDRAKKSLARKLVESFEFGGREEVLARARDHRLRIPVHR